MIGSRIAKVEIKITIAISNYYFLFLPEKKLLIIILKILSINIIQ